MVTEFVMGVNVQGMSLGWGKHSGRSTGTISQSPQGASPGGSVIFSINRETQYDICQLQWTGSCTSANMRIRYAGYLIASLQVTDHFGFLLIKMKYCCHHGIKLNFNCVDSL